MRWHHLRDAVRQWLDGHGLQVSDLTPMEAALVRVLADSDLTPKKPIDLVTTPGKPLWFQRPPRGIQ